MSISYAVSRCVANVICSKYSIDWVPFLSAGRDGYDFQCNDAFRLSRELEVSPFNIAHEISMELAEDPLFAKVSATGKGFINLRIDDAYLHDFAVSTLSNGVKVGHQESARKVVIDFGGPNICKPLHVGHLRSFVIGESLRRILVATGHDVFSDIHLGDWGLQMGMLLMESRKLYPDVDEPDISINDLEAMYRAASSRCKEYEECADLARKMTAEMQAGDPGLLKTWAHFRRLSVSALRGQYSHLGAHFDLLLGESDTQEQMDSVLSDLIDRGVAVKNDGALVIPLSEEQSPPLMLQNSSGGVLYGATDLVCLKQRMDDLSPDQIIYCVDQRQSQHFQNVFEASKQAGYAANVDLSHAGFGTVKDANGKPFKTREGEVVRLSVLIDEAVKAAAVRLQGRGMSQDALEESARQIGIGALKFADLSTDRLSGYVFDIERMLSFEGKTGPYVQYACARITSLSRKADGVGMNAIYDLSPLTPGERDLLMQCASYGDAVSKAVEGLQPKEIAECVHSIAQSFGRLYSEEPILNDRTRGPRKLAIAQIAFMTMSNGLELLGIEIPESM